MDERDYELVIADRNINQAIRCLLESGVKKLYPDTMDDVHAACRILDRLALRVAAELTHRIHDIKEMPCD